MVMRRNLNGDLIYQGPNGELETYDLSSDVTLIFSSESPTVRGKELHIRSTFFREIKIINYEFKSLFHCA